MSSNRLGSDFVEAARAFLGVPFRHQGRGIEGIDCAGLLVLSAAAVGVTLEDIQNYPTTPDGTLMAIVARNADPVIGPWQAGDALLMRNEGEPQHLAIWTEENTIIHASNKVGYKRVIEHRMNSVLRANVVSAWRIRGFA